MSAQIHAAPHSINAWIAWGLDRATDTDTRRAAISLLVEMERHWPAAAAALERIDSTDPLGLMLRYEARQAYWGDEASEILPETAEARRLALRFAELNRPQIARDQRGVVARYVAKVALTVTALAGCALIGSALWADTSARLEATLGQARCGDVCIFTMED